MIGRGHTFSGDGCQPRESALQVSAVRVSAPGLRFPAAGGWNAEPRMADALMAVTRHQRMSLSSASIIDPVIAPFRVAGGSPGWQVAGLAAQPETG